ncbi:hypothetical protein ACFCZY_37590 [Streptomyces sp. NPDC056237]
MTECDGGGDLDADDAMGDGVLDVTGADVDAAYAKAAPPAS